MTMSDNPLHEFFPPDLGIEEQAFILSSVARLALAFQSILRRHPEWDAGTAANWVARATLLKVLGIAADSAKIADELELALAKIDPPVEALESPQVAGSFSRCCRAMNAFPNRLGYSDTSRI